MLLAIDVGNTNTVFALVDDKALLWQWRCRTEGNRTADEYFVWLQELLEHRKIDTEITKIIISSVVPQVVYNLRVLCDQYFSQRPIVVGKVGVKLGVPVRVDAETQVGADRLVNTVGAYDLYGGGLVVVDFGTATTFDVVGNDGAYEGGVIAPGVNLSLKALHEAAAALPHIDVTIPNKVVGTNTLECMQSGIFWGYVGLIEGICERISAERGKKMKIIGTGGLSPLFAQGTKVLDLINTDLTIHGLVLIAKENE